jgi:DNA-binding transcriptional MerR regulator
MLLKVADMARRFGETENTIRYWCDQFAVPVLRGKGGHRLFNADSQTALSEVRRLVRGEGMTVARAKRKLGIQ